MVGPRAAGGRIIIGTRTPSLGGLRRALAGTPAAALARRESWARRLERVGVLDREYYALQTGEDFRTDLDALRHFVSLPEGGDVSLNPFLEPEWLTSRHGDGTSATMQLLAPEGDRSPGPFWPTPPVGDPVEAIRDASRQARDEPGSPAARHRAVVVDNARLLRDLAQAAAMTEGASAPRAGDLTDGDIDVVVPSGDDPTDLSLRLDSLVAQEHRTWRAVVVPDPHPGSTLDVARDLSTRDARISVLDLDSGSHGETLDAGVAAGSAPLVAFLPVGTRWASTHLGTMVSARVDPAAIVVARSTNTLTGPGTPRSAGASPESLLVLGDVVPLGALLVPRPALESVGPVDTTLGGGHDFDLVLRLLESTAGTPASTTVRHRAPSRPGLPTSPDDPRVWDKHVIERRLVDWSTQRAGVDDRVVDRLSVCMPTFQDWSMTIRAVDAVLDTAAGRDVEVVVVDNGSRRSVSSILAGRYADEPRVTIVRAPQNLNFALGSNLAFARSSGAHVLFLNNDTVVQPGALDLMIERLESDDTIVAVQPLLLYPDGTVQTAGTFFAGERILPWHLLAGHPREDAERGDLRRFSAVTAAAMAMRASDVVALEGFDTRFTNGLEDVDLCLRGLALRTEAHHEVETRAVVEHHESKSTGRKVTNTVNRSLFDERWSGAYPVSDLPRYEHFGLAAPHLGATPPAEFRMLRRAYPVVVRPRRDVATGPRAGEPCLRWAVKTPTDSTVSTGTDDPLVRRLVAALERNGQEVVVDGRQNHYRASGDLDDVTLTLEGETPVSPQPGSFAVLWRTRTEALGPLERQIHDVVVPLTASHDVDTETDRLVELALAEARKDNR